MWRGRVEEKDGEVKNKIFKKSLVFLFGVEELVRGENPYAVP